MAFSYIGSTNITVNTAGSQTISLPGGVQNGDIIFFNYSHQSGFIVTPPSGFTVIYGRDINGFKHEVWYKIAINEPISYTYTPPSGKHHGVMSVFRGGFNPTNPIHSRIDKTLSSGSYSIIAGSLTTTFNNQPLLFFGSTYSQSSINFTKPSIPSIDRVENYDVWSTTPDIGTTICSMVMPISGSTGEIYGTVSLITSNEHAFAVALNPEVLSSGNMFSMF